MKDRKSEMQNRIEYEMRYIDRCQKYDIEIDWDRVKSGFINAFAAGIVAGDCGDNPIFELGIDTLKLDDKNFRILLDAMTTKASNRKEEPENITLKFPDNRLTNTSLEALAHALTNANFPQHVTIDLSRSAGFSNSGVEKLLETLSDEKCNLSVNIMMPKNPRMVKPQLLNELTAKLSENQHRYQYEQQHQKKKATKNRLFKRKEDGEEKAVKITKKEKAPRKTLFTRKPKDTNTQETGRRRYTKHHSEE